MKQYVREINGKVEFYREPLIKDGMQIFNAPEEEIKAAGWEEYIPQAESTEEPEMSYEDRVATLIRERYSVDDEIALLRERDSRPDEYTEYLTFCEECKEKAKNKNEE